MTDQFPGATKKVLSPAAQAVLDACDQAFDQCGTTAQGLAAALRTAADQVLPEEPLHGGDQRWTYERDTRQESRKKLLAIAAELKSQ